LRKEKNRNKRMTAVLLQRYLKVLECPLEVELTDESIHKVDFQELLILWLEDRKIREYEIEQRKEIKLGTYSKDNRKWAGYIDQFLRSLGCPFRWVYQDTDKIPESNQQGLFWLISRAIALDYEDALENEEHAENAMEVAEFQPSNYDVLVQKCEELGRMLELQRKPDEPLVGMCLS
jgi:hypothetical protein